MNVHRDQSLRLPNEMFMLCDSGPHYTTYVRGKFCAMSLFIAHVSPQKQLVFLPTALAVFIGSVLHYSFPLRYG